MKKISKCMTVIMTSAMLVISCVAIPTGAGTAYAGESDKEHSNAEAMVIVTKDSNMTNIEKVGADIFWTERLIKKRKEVSYSKLEPLAGYPGKYTIKGLTQGQYDIFLSDGNGRIKDAIKYIYVDENNIAKEGYKFDKYTASKHEPRWHGDNPRTPIQDITVFGETEITAHIKPIEYSVGFDKNSTTATGAIKIQKFVYEEPEKALIKNNYSRDGYTFKGWTKDIDGKGYLYTDEKKVKNLTTKETEAGNPMPLYAQWTPNTYKVEFCGTTGSTGIMSSQEMTYDEEKNLSKNTIMRKDYHFRGWNTKKDGTGTFYKDGEQVKNLTSENGGVVKLYTMWEHNSYRINFNPNGGEGSMEDVFVPTREKVKLEKNKFTREGYTFKGWNTNSDGTGKRFADEAYVEDLARSRETVILYAQWEKTSKGDEDNPADDRSSKGGTSTAGSKVNTGDGSSIIGWFGFLGISLLSTIALWFKKKKI